MERNLAFRDRATIRWRAAKVTTYSYDKVWSEIPITSHTFRHPEGHNNPPMPFQTTVFDAADLRIGAYSPDRDLIVKLKEFQPIDPVATTVPAGFRQTTLGFYRGVDENSPRIGDLRVSFKGFPLQQVSSVAMQRDAMLVPYFSKTGSRVQLIEAGSCRRKRCLLTKRQSNLFWHGQSVPVVCS
jgi:hypothetical protein